MATEELDESLEEANDDDENRRFFQPEGSSENSGAEEEPKAASRLIEEDDGEEEEISGGVVVGGDIEEPAYALLAGIYEDPKDSSIRTPISVPITRIPATLGRTHENSDRNFFGLGKQKALSRKQCIIEYRNAAGGKIGQFDVFSNRFFYKEPEPGNSDTPNRLSSGYFAIECVGKNRIFVNGDRVEPGHSVRLKSGTPIRLNTYMLYFLLPTNEVGSPQKSLAINPTPKKRKFPGPPMLAGSAGSNSAPKKPKPHGGGPGLQAELDSLPVETLLERMTEAIEMHQWERRHQFIGSTIAVHAVKAAAESPHIQDKARDGGVSRSEIMDWIKNSPKYSQWVEQMLTKVEARSYQSSITKALLKAGFVRTGSSGRYIKWLLPKSIRKGGSPTKVKESKVGGKELIRKEIQARDDDSDNPSADDESNGGGDDEDDAEAGGEARSESDEEEEGGEEGNEAEDGDGEEAGGEDVNMDVDDDGEDDEEQPVGAGDEGEIEDEEDSDDSNNSG